MRGLAVVESGSILSDGPLSDQQLTELSTLGWLVEIFQAYLLTLDDVIDKSNTRRGKPCWYKRPGVGMIAVNDACLLKSQIFYILRIYFRSHPSYVDFLETFEEISLITEIGQDCDWLASQQSSPTSWPWATYDAILVFKAGYYTLYLSVLLALHYFGLSTPGNVQQCKSILIDMGKFYQIQNDFLDVFGALGRTKKDGTDIQENKCSWVIMKALEVCSDDQKQILEDNYGRDSPQALATVRAVFETLPLEQMYDEEERNWKARISRMIEDVDETEGLRKEVFRKLLECFPSHKSD